MVVKKEYEICYESDFSGLKGKVERVVFPKNGGEVANVIKSAGEYDVVPRGFGISSVGGCIPNNSIILDMRKMNKVVDFNGSDRTVYAEAGVSLKELNEKLKKIGFEFPISHDALRSIGGLIALDLIGDRFRYGSAKDWVEEIELVNGRGEIFKVGKADLMDVCGMEGITGVIVSAKLKVTPLIKRSMSIFQSDNLEEVLSIAKRLRLDKEVIMLKLCSKKISKMMSFPGKYHLLIEFDSMRGKITRASYERLVRKKDRIYFFLYSKGHYESLDTKLFLDKIPEFIKFLDEKGIPYFSNIGLGVVSCFFGEGKEDVLNFLKNTKTKFFGGFGIKKKNLIESGEKKIIERVKKRYDPFNKINRGKVVDLMGENGIEKVREIEIKSPVKEMDDFVGDIRAKEERDKQINNFVDRVEKKIEDYNQTFGSELVNSKKERVEGFAKEIPQKIVKEEDKKVDELIERKKDDELKDTLDKFGLGADFEGSDKEEEDN